MPTTPNSCFNLPKGSRVALQKEGLKLNRVFVGLNWGAIVKATGTIVDVDLDASVTSFDAAGREMETIYFNKLTSSDKSIKHFGDDLSGDWTEDDGMDNEVIQVDLNRINAKVQTLVFFLNSFNSQDLGDLPFFQIRIFEGERLLPEAVFAKCDIPSDASFTGNVALIIGKIVRTPNGWEFEAIGEAVFAMDVEETVAIIQEEGYLS